MRKVLRVLMVWTALGVILAPLVGKAIRGRREPPERPERLVPLGQRGHPVHQALPDHLEAWVSRDRPAIPAHLANRANQAPRALPDRPVVRVNRVRPDRSAAKGSTSKS